MSRFAVSTLRRTLAECINWLLWVLIAGLLAQNLALLRQNRQFKSGAISTVPADETVPVGRILRNLAGVGLDGKYHAVSLPEDNAHPLLLVTFSSECPACESDQNPTLDAVATARRLGWNVVWISRDSIPVAAAWSRQNGIDAASVLTEVPMGTYLQLGMRAVPKVLAVGPFGHVERVWSGALTPAEFQEMKGYFRPRLHEMADAEPDNGSEP